MDYHDIMAQDDVFILNAHEISFCIYSQINLDMFVIKNGNWNCSGYTMQLMTGEFVKLYCAWITHWN